jgi:hypothetical protein
MCKQTRDKEFLKRKKTSATDSKNDETSTHAMDCPSIEITKVTDRVFLFSE